MFRNQRRMWNVVKPVGALNKCIVRHVTAHLVVVVAYVAAGCGQALADFTFGTPTNLGPTVNSPSYDSDMSISADGLSLYFTSNRSGGSGTHDIWVTTRETAQDPWGEPVNLGPTVNSSDWEHTPFVSADGLTLYFSSTRPGGSGTFSMSSSIDRA